MVELNVRLEVEFCFSNGHIGFAKEVYWPFLLPIGSVIFADGGEHDGEDMEIESYGWYEKSSIFYAAMKPIEDVGEIPEWFEEWMNSLGWKTNGKCTSK